MRGVNRICKVLPSKIVVLVSVWVALPENHLLLPKTIYSVHFKCDSLFDLTWFSTRSEYIWGLRFVVQFNSVFIDFVYEEARAAETLDEWNRYQAREQRIVFCLFSDNFTFEHVLLPRRQNFDPTQNGSHLGPKEQGQEGEGELGWRRRGLQERVLGWRPDDVILKKGNFRSAGVAGPHARGSPNAASKISDWLLHHPSASLLLESS